MSMFCCGRLLNDLSSPLQKFLHKCQTLKRSVWDVASYFPPAWVPFDLFPFPEPVTDYSKWNMSVPVTLMVSFLQASGLLHKPVQKSHSFVNTAVWLLSCELQWVKCKCIWGLSLSRLRWSLVLYLLFVLEHFSSLPSVFPVVVPCLLTAVQQRASQIAHPCFSLPFLAFLPRLCTWFS